MITLIISTLQNVDFGVVLGYILSGLEILIVCLTLISFFVPADSKVGKTLSYIMKGLYNSKDYIKEYKKEHDIPDNKDDKEDIGNEDQSEHN